MWEPIAGEKPIKRAEGQKGVRVGIKAELVNLREVQYLLLLSKLEALAALRRKSVKQGGVDEHLDRLEHERALASAIDLYALLKDSDQTAGARDPPVL